MSTDVEEKKNDEEKNSSHFDERKNSTHKGTVFFAFSENHTAISHIKICKITESRGVKYPPR